MEAPVVAPAMPDGTFPFRRVASDFLANPVAVAGLALLGLVVAAAIFAPLISPQNPYDLAQIDILDSKLPPGSPSSTGGTFWLGTDDQGRDMLSAIFYGLRISLAVGVISTVLALVIGLAAGLADRCEIQVSYAIGVAKPTSVTVETFGTNKVPEEKIAAAVSKNFDLRPYGIVKMLDLLKPVYRKTASYGHFGRSEFSWEKTDRAEALKADAK